MPSTIRVTLPYDPKTDLWELASGGAGFRVVSLHNAPTSSNTGTQTFTFRLVKKTTVPVVLFYQAPGAQPQIPKGEFRITLHGS